MGHIKVTHAGKRYAVEFDHLERNVEVPKTKKETTITGKRMVTTCSIWLVLKKGTKLVGSGSATCRPPDKFSRPVGRKLALARAIVKLTGPRKQLVLRGPKGKKYGVLKERMSGEVPELARREPIKKALALRTAIWGAYFARVKCWHKSPWFNVDGGTVRLLTPTALSAKQLRGICDAAASKKKLPPMRDFEERGR